MLVEARRRRNPYRDAALIILLLDTGLRIGEVANLTLRDVDWIDAALAVDGKTGPRIVPLGRKAKRALRVYVDRGRTAATSRELHVFLTLDGEALSSQAATQVVRRIAEAAGAKASKLGPHSFRHTFSVEFVRAGGDAFTLQRILGHTTIDMTRRYVNLADTDLRAAHRRFAPADAWL